MIILVLVSLRIKPKIQNYTWRLLKVRWHSVCKVPELEVAARLLGLCGCPDCKEREDLDELT